MLVASVDTHTHIYISAVLCVAVYRQECQLVDMVFALSVPSQSVAMQCMLAVPSTADCLAVNCRLVKLDSSVHSMLR